VVAVCVFPREHSPRLGTLGLYDGRPLAFPFKPAQGGSLVLQRDVRMFTLRAVMQLTLSRTLLVHALILIGVGGAIVAYRQVTPVQVEEMPEPTPEDLAEIARLSEAVQEFERQNLTGHGYAEKLYRDLIALQERYLVPEHPEIMPNRKALARNLQDMGHYAEAEKEHRVVLKMLRRVMGAEDPDTLKYQAELAHMLERTGKLAEAEQEYRLIYTLQELALGKEHPDTLATQLSLATTLDVEAKYADEERELRELLSLQRRVLGVKHQNVVLNCGALARCLRAQGKMQEALEYAQEFEAGQTRILGADAPLAREAKAFRESIEAELKKRQAK
jgi:hypothetical protein